MILFYATRPLGYILDYTAITDCTTVLLCTDHQLLILHLTRNSVRALKPASGPAPSFGKVLACNKTCFTDCFCFVSSKPMDKLMKLLSRGPSASSIDFENDLATFELSKKTGPLQEKQFQLVTCTSDLNLVAVGAPCVWTYKTNFGGVSSS